MAENDLNAHAQNFVSTASRHPQCKGARVVDVSDTEAFVELDLDVTMPQHMKAAGGSPNGVRLVETTSVKLRRSYPWTSPTFYLREDFPRDLPHLHPSPPDALPRPCLIDGSQREYFVQFGLVELGVFNLVHQLVLWLQRAAEGTLIDPEQGWEPTLRRGLQDTLVIDAEYAQGLAGRDGGHCVLKADYYRSGLLDDRITENAWTIVDVTNNAVPLKREDENLFTAQPLQNASAGYTVGCVVWPDKLPSGKAFVASTYMPETVGTLGALRKRADDLNCGRAFDAFLSSLERCWSGISWPVPIPIAITLCARRPCHVIGSTSDIELLPYLIEIRALEGRTSLFPGGDEEPVAPMMQLDRANPTLLRRVSGAPAVGQVAMLGSGSVGSKMAVHLARSGIEVPILCDEDLLMPHNMARHALARTPLASYKASELAKELALLGQEPQVYKEDLVGALSTREGRRAVLPKNASFAVNTTASLSVREALSALPPKELKLRLAEAALFGRGHGGFLLVEGAEHNPTLSDLIAEIYARPSSSRARNLMVDPEHGLTEVQIGQGCGSLTMPMTDSRLSSMTAGLTEKLVEEMTEPNKFGRVIVGATEAGSLNTTWHERTVPPFIAVPIEPTDGWTLRISQRVLDDIRADIALYPGVETGGVMIGSCSARLKTITLVDVIPAPPDSDRSAGRFVLGTSGLKKAIEERHRQSGGTLFDIGTWHSHLSDHGPSPTDRQTAKELAAERPPPSALLIVTPNELHALMHPAAT